MTTAEIVNNVSNDADLTIAGTEPYVARFTLAGTARMLFNRWSCDDIEAKAKAPKGSAVKKTDNVKAYVWRCEDGTLAIPGEYVRMAMVNAGRWYRDPSSTGRKCAVDLLKAAVIPLTELATLGVTEWDYLDRRRVTVQRNGITRERPAMNAGWSATFEMQVQLPEYVTPALARDILGRAGRQVGIGDFRPTFGRFTVTAWDISDF